MDDTQLKKIMENIEIPAPDGNAKKGAVNLAVAEFQTHQKEKEKKFQGFPILARLIGTRNTEKRKNSMEMKFKKKLFYGSAVTALGLALFSAPMIMNKSLSTIGAGSTVETGATINQAELTMMVFGSEERLDSDMKKAEKPKERMEVKEEQFAGLLKNMSETSSIAAPKMKREMARRQVMPESLMLEKTIIADVAFDSNVDAELIINDYRDEGRDKFEDFKINPIKQVTTEPVSTFSVDVDTASYSFIRRQLNSGVLPQKDAVRIEEMINYFDYNYAVPEDKAAPFKPTVTLIDSPWAEGKKLMHVGIKGYEITGAKPKSNLVFLLDVSGSMSSPDKLPLVKNSMKMLLDNLNADDTVSIVVYAGAAGAVLEPTKVSERSKIYAAFDRLSAGGSTAGAAGINLAYQLAEQNFDKNAVNRVILATDGDFNVGITNQEELKDFVERKRETGIFLSVLGFGQGNYNDHMMQVLAQNGNGVAAYIDSLNEARKVLVDEATSSLFTIAKDVKIQVEFNPKTVSEYRLIGYETRALKREDFNNDKIDAGDIGAGHTVTAIYEITPVGSEAVSIDDLRYGVTEQHKANTDFSGEYGFLKIRYKLPNEDTSKLITTPVSQDHVDGKRDVTDTNFATAVAGFGQILQGGQYTGTFSYDDVIKLAQSGKGEDSFGYRAEFINLVRLANSASDL